MSKRGQVTIFIILGIIILLVSGFLFFMSDNLFSLKMDEVKEITDTVPTDFVPVQSFVTNCLDQVSKQGLYRLGSQGGYIYPTVWENMFFSASNPTDSDGVTLPNINVPYWIHNTVQNDEESVSLRSAVPTKEYMQVQLARYVEDEIDRCLSNFESYRPQAFEVVTEQPKATVNIIPGAVRIALKYPMTVSRGKTDVDLQNFFVKHDVDLNGVYDAALQIYELERNSTFLELNTLGLITIFSGENMFMPMTDTTFELASASVWTEPQMLQDLKVMLANYVPLFRYANSRNFFDFAYPRSSATAQSVYDSFVLPLSGAERFDVRFNYLPYWDAYLNLGSGTVYRPESVTVPLGVPPLGFFGVQRYDAVYDISYPVYVSITDPQAFGNRGYMFSFALESNIRNNRPARSGDLPPAYTPARQSLFCEPHQWTNRNLTVNVKDAATGAPVEDAVVTYKINSQKCTVGKTNVAGVLKSPFPESYGGILEVLKAGYATKQLYVDTAGDVESVSLDLYPYHEVNVTVLKKKIVNCNGPCMGHGPLIAPELEGWTPSTASYPLRETETAMVMLKSLDANTLGYTTIITGNEVQPMNLPAGNYTLQISIMLDEEVVIPEDEDCTRVLFDEECVTIPQVTFDQFPNGGLVWNGTLHLELDKQNYYGASKLTLFAVSPAITDIPVNDRKIKHLDELDMIDKYSIQYKDMLRPRYE